MPREKTSTRTKFKSKCGDHRPPFTCGLVGKTCSGTKRDGKPCGRTTFRPYEMCWQHLRKEMKVNVCGPSAKTTLKDSKGNRFNFKGLKAHIPNSVRRQREKDWDAGKVPWQTRRAKYVTRGPKSNRWNYVNIAFRPGVKDRKVVVPKYIGQTITNDQKRGRYGKSSPPYGIWYGDKNTIDGACKRGVANYANHKPHGRANAHFQKFNAAGDDAYRILASKNIYHGQEVFVSYGSGYRMKQCAHTTS